LLREAIAEESAAGKPNKREYIPLPLCPIRAGPSWWLFLAFAASAYMAAPVTHFVSFEVGDLIKAL
jgi:hypothetical protein